MADTKPQEIYQIKVTLLGTDPPIWRRVLVPSGLTLEQLHVILQIAMDWRNSHMHEFAIGDQRYAEPDPVEDGFGGPPPRSERTARLSSVLSNPHAQAVYTYDFGDSWEHDLTVEKRFPPEPGAIYPVCLAGERHAPPEDCGGIPGFYNLLDAIRDPAHEEHEDLLEWLGGSFDPDAFSVEEVNRRLRAFARRSNAAKPRKRAAGRSHETS